MLWRQTVDDSHETEEESRKGGQIELKVSPKLVHDVQLLVSRLAAKAHQLIGNHTTNLAEVWMHIRCKFDGGKVINRSQSGSWQHRCMGAGLAQNVGEMWSPEVWNTMTQEVPNPILSKVAECSKKKAEKQRKRKAIEMSKIKRRQSKYSRKDNSLAARKAYSRHDGDVAPDDIVDDISEERLSELKSNYYTNKVVVSKKEVEEIEQDTREQSISNRLTTERRKQLTASVVGGISKMQNKTKRAKKVENLLYSKFRGSDATRYGLLMEDPTRERYTHSQQQSGHHEITTVKTGLVVSMDNPWLAVSPDDN